MMYIYLYTYLHRVYPLLHHFAFCSIFTPCDWDASVLQGCPTPYVFCQYGSTAPKNASTLEHKITTPVLASQIQCGLGIPSPAHPA